MGAFRISNMLSELLKIRNILRFVSCAFIISCVFLYYGCGSDPEDEQNLTPEELMSNAWRDYNAGEYGKAILSFEEALADDDKSAIAADAYNGLGWVYLGFSRSHGINRKNIEIALGKFQEAVSLDRNNADAWVGRAGLLLIRRNSQDDLNDALNAIDNALQGNTDYLYRHDYDSEADLGALKAQCHYYLGDEDKAKDEIDQVLAIEKNNSVALAIQGLL